MTYGRLITTCPHGQVARRQLLAPGGRPPVLLRPPAAPLGLVPPAVKGPVEAGRAARGGRPPLRDDHLTPRRASRRRAAGWSNPETPAVAPVRFRGRPGPVGSPSGDGVWGRPDRRGVPARRQVQLGPPPTAAPAPGVYRPVPQAGLFSEHSRSVFDRADLESIGRPPRLGYFSDARAAGRDARATVASAENRGRSIGPCSRPAPVTPAGFGARCRRPATGGTAHTPSATARTGPAGPATTPRSAPRIGPR